MWKQVQTKGNPPCAREDHALAVCGATIFVYGGSNGKAALGDMFTLSPGELAFLGGFKLRVPCA